MFLLNLLKNNPFMILKWGLIVVGLLGLGFKSWQANNYKKKYIVSQEKILQRDVVIKSLQRYNNALQKAVKSDKVERIKIQKRYKDISISFKKLKGRYLHVKKFININIPSELNIWMHKKYGSECKDSRGKNSRCLLRRNQASRMVNDFIVYIAKLDKALASCNKDKRIIKRLIIAQQTIP